MQEPVRRRNFKLFAVGWLQTIVDITYAERETHLNAYEVMQSELHFSINSQMYIRR